MATGFKKVSDDCEYYIVFGKQGYIDAKKDYLVSSFYFSPGNYPEGGFYNGELPALIKFSQNPTAPDCLVVDGIPLSVLKAAIAECPED